jgi:putative flippase GtrA
MTNGVLSLAGNLLLMHLFVGLWRVPPVAANLASIAVCSLATFVLSDRLVFTTPGSATRR